MKRCGGCISQNRFAAKVATSLNPASLRAPSFSRRLQNDHSWHRQIFIVGLLAITKSPGGADVTQPTKCRNRRLQKYVSLSENCVAVNQQRRSAIGCNGRTEI